MSKVQTLLKIIQYQKEHPNAKDFDIASAVRISERYVIECKKEIQEISYNLSSPTLERKEVDFLISKLEKNSGYERVIINKLQRIHPIERDGLIEITSPEDKPRLDYFQIGICAPKEDQAHLNFWLKSILYDTLLWVDKDGEIDYRLASICKNIEGYTKWYVELKKGLCWSDGKPITSDDVVNTLLTNPFASMFKEIKKNDEDKLLLNLAQDDVLFPYKLSNIPILPSHLYKATSGPFLLKKERSSALFHLYRNKDYYKKGYPKIDWLSIRAFRYPHCAVRSVIKKNSDLFPVRSLQEVHVWPSARLQSFPFEGLSYWLLLINEKKGHLKQESDIHQLRESIDYNAINLYFSAKRKTEIEPLPRPQKILNLRIGYTADMITTEIQNLIQILSHCLGITNPKANLVGVYNSSEDLKETVDAMLTQIYFGHGYSRLRQYFHSEGRRNTFGFNCPEIDSLIDELDMTISMKDRKIKGQEIVLKLQEKNAIILLAPCFEQVLSNLYIVPSPKLNTLTDLILNLSTINIRREKVLVYGDQWNKK